jgi:hypothetical protein
LDHIKGTAYTEGVWEQGSKENIQQQNGGNFTMKSFIIYDHPLVSLIRLNQGG